MDFSNEIRAYSLQNALEFGKADAGKVLSKLFRHGLKKEDVKLVMGEVQKMVASINSMSKDQISKEFELFESFVRKPDEVETGLAELPNIKKNKKPVFRIAPFPSGALHLGNAKTFLLNALYAEKYHGKILLVIDDTIGSVKKQPIKEGYDLIVEAIDELGIKYHKPIVYKSDRLKHYYKYAEKLIKLGKAYVDFTPPEKMREMRAQGMETGDRVLPPKVQLERWKKMFKMKEGKAVLRIKTDMSHKNPAFRDRVLFKISNRKHPRVGKKYTVWPTLEMSWAVDDHELGVTHILRGNDLVMETEMEKYLWDIFGWKYPEVIHTGLVKIEGLDSKMSKSKSQEEVKSGGVTGWDDPRTWSIQSLIKRGIRPEAIKKFVEEIGLNRQDITVPIETLYSLNRRIIDSTSLRYSFVSKPVKIKTDDVIELDEVEVPLHPDISETRKIKIKNIYVSGEDFKKYKGKEVRLLHLFNIKLGKNSKITSIGVEKARKFPKLNWVSEHSKAKVLMPDGKWIEGIVEEAVTNLEVGAIIQLERFGFCRYWGVKKGVCEFWFAHG